LSGAVGGAFAVIGVTALFANVAFGPFDRCDVVNALFDRGKSLPEIVDG